MNVGRTERLLNLVIALLAARVPITRNTIQSSIVGYDPDATPSAFERMLERDKDELRGMGIPIRTVTNASGEVEGYLLDTEEYALIDVELTADELSAVALASHVWDQAVLAPAAMTAARKIEAACGGSPPFAAPTTFASLTANDAAIIPLIQALQRHTVVTFKYRKPGLDHADTRHVEPWTLLSREGQWYMWGFDRDRDAPRTFRLSRIEGVVKVTAEAIKTTAPAKVSLDPEEEPDAVTAYFDIPPGVGVELKRMPGSRYVTSTRWEVTGQREELLRAFMRADSSVRLIEPDDLKEEATRIIATVATAHQ